MTVILICQCSCLSDSNFLEVVAEKNKVFSVCDGLILVPKLNFKRAVADLGRMLNRTTSNLISTNLTNICMSGPKMVIFYTWHITQWV